MPLMNKTLEHLGRSYKFQVHSVQGMIKNTVLKSQSFLCTGAIKTLHDQ